VFFDKSDARKIIPSISVAFATAVAVAVPSAKFVSARAHYRTRLRWRPDRPIRSAMRGRGPAVAETSDSVRIRVDETGVVAAGLISTRGRIAVAGPAFRCAFADAVGNPRVQSGRRPLRRRFMRKPRVAGPARRHMRERQHVRARQERSASPPRAGPPRRGLTTRTVLAVLRLL